MKKLLICVMVLMLCAASMAEEALRVNLISLESPSRVHLTLRGDYAIQLGATILLSEGSEIELFQKSGHVRLNAEGVAMDFGEEVTLSRQDDGGIQIAESGRENLYPGDLRICAGQDGLKLILHVDVEDYLKGVVPYEMSDSFPLEALKAQAIAARTYALGKVRPDRDWDVTDTTSDQVFRGIDAKHVNAAQAVEATRGMVLMVDDELAQCYYTASNGGQIARPEDAWGGESDGAISLKDDPYDLENPRSLVNSIEFCADLSDCAALKRMIQSRLGDGQTFQRILTLTPAKPKPADSARYTQLIACVETDSGEAEITLDVYDDIKDPLKLGLNRTDYELISIHSTGDGFRVEMRRFGHGVGMSQRGAQQMAACHHKTYREILAFYISGATLARIN